MITTRALAGSGSGIAMVCSCLRVTGIQCGGRATTVQSTGGANGTVTVRRAGHGRETIEAMRVQRFRVRVSADARGHAVIAIPFDPDEAWGAKAVHHVNGTVNDCRVRVTIAPGEGGWAFTLNPSRTRGMGIAAGSDVVVELAPEGPQRADLADDISEALAANPAAGAFFDTLAQFYRKAYLRYIDATTRRPDLRAARIAEVTGLLADGIKERPRPETGPSRG
jgi:hypothetical protein